jgi:replication factor A1
MLSLEEILTELEDKTKFSREELQEKIKSKHEELSGLVSLEGAGHLVARDLGVNLLTVERKPLKIEQLSEDMSSIKVKGRITQITGIREFDRKDGSTGRVCNIFISDGTGRIRIPLWDKQVKMIEDGTLSTGDIIKLKGVSVKKNTYGGLEIRTSKYSQLDKLEDDESIPEEPVKIASQRIDIKEVEEGFYEIQGTFVQLFNTSPIFRLCPECRKKVEKKDDDYVCEEHGKVEPKKTMIISGIVDDGTSTIRTVFFRDQAEEFSGLKPEVLDELSDMEGLDLIEESVLGREVVLSGRIRKNKLFENLELVVNDVKDLNVEKEAKKLLTEIENYGG